VTSRNQEGLGGREGGREEGGQGGTGVGQQGIACVREGMHDASEGDGGLVTHAVRQVPTQVQEPGQEGLGGEEGREEGGDGQA